jgi:hypothetical protein
MPKANRSKPASPSHQLTLGITDTEAGIHWLSSLTEPEFRDSVLPQLFKAMKREDRISSFENIHGRNDKGIDLLVSPVDEFRPKLLGIQAKSKPISRAGANASLSAVQIKQECIAAMQHEFTFNGTPTRLDNIELWCSAHITEDAEKEFYAAASPMKVGVQKAPAVFALIERYCPELVQKIPGVALTTYIAKRKNPPSKSLKVLGCDLNPKLHFLEPIFSRTAVGSYKRLETKNKVLQLKHEKISLLSILTSNRHTIVLSPDLSGRTYLLEHCETIIADGKGLPVFLKGKDLPTSAPRSIESLIASNLKFCTPKQLEDLSKQSRIFLLVDDLDKSKEEVQKFLFSLDPEKYKVFSTARALVAPAKVDTFHIVGVDLGNIISFVRSLDKSLATDKSFVDRARSYIARTLDSSGLPQNPFTVSVMLHECQTAKHRFTTPTMGRLIERFVELQLGSHSDNLIIVDFETKREFLTRLAGHPQTVFRETQFRRELIRFLQSRGHPHSIADFVKDLTQTGVFQVDGQMIGWAHPAIRTFFWVKNLQTRQRIAPLVAALKKKSEPTLAALVGSQFKNAKPIIEELLKDIFNLRLPSTSKVLSAIKGLGSVGDLISDEEEEELLSKLEDPDSAGHGDAASILGRKTPADEKLLPEQRENENEPDEASKRLIRIRIEDVVKQFADARSHLGGNLASLLVNARDTPVDAKEQAVAAIIKTILGVGDFVGRLLQEVLPQNKQREFFLGWIRLSIEMQLADELIGDPFLINIFRQQFHKAKSDDEILILCDLVLCCGEEDYQVILKKIRKLNRVDVLFALYLRVASLYFFRHHKPIERSTLRALLKELRKSKDLDLPTVI